MFSNKKESPVGNSNAVIGVIRRSHRHYPIRQVVVVLFVALVVGAVGYKAFPYAKEFVVAKYNQIRGGSSYEPIAGGNQSTQAPGSTTITPGKTTQTSAQTPGATPIYCGVSGMPSGVCDIAKSVEASGLKNNPGVIAMVDSIPDGTQVTLNYGSWKMDDSETGYIDGTAKAYGTTKSGTLTFRFLDGSWKVTSVDIN